MDRHIVEQLKQELQAFKREFECSPTGVWIDENKTKLIVVGALGLIAGTYVGKHLRGYCE